MDNKEYEEYGLIYKIIFKDKYKGRASNLNGIYTELSALWVRYKDDPDFKVTIERAKEDE